MDMTLLGYCIVCVLFYLGNITAHDKPTDLRWYHILVGIITSPIMSPFILGYRLGKIRKALGV